MLTALCLTSFAQQEEIKVIGTDTFATVKVQRLREANAKNIELRGCKEENDSLYSQNRSYQGLANNLRSSITDLKEANRLNETLLSDKQKIIDLTDKELKKAGRKAKWLKIQRTSLAGACLVLMAKVFLFK